MGARGGRSVARAGDGRPLVSVNPPRNGFWGTRRIRDRQSSFSGRPSQDALDQRCARVCFRPVADVWVRVSLSRMIRFYPIDIEIPFDCARSELVSFQWQDMSADFRIPDDDERLLLVSFDTDAIIRILDEMPLSTESDPATWEGLVPHNFAYRIEGASFPGQQSSAWREVAGPVKHFRFVTGNGCLDVLTSGDPRISFPPVPGKMSA